MPVVYVKMYKGKTKDQKRKIVKGITQAVMDAIKVNETQVRVVFEEYPKENLKVGAFPFPLD